MNQSSDVSTNGASPDSSRALSALPEERGMIPLADNSSVYGRDADEESFDWQRFLGILRRRRKVIGLTLASVLTLAGIYLALSPKIYKESRYLLGVCHILEPRGAPKFLKNWLGNAYSPYDAGHIDRFL